MLKRILLFLAIAIPCFAQSGAFTGAYYANINGAVEKWDFSADGTFTHTGIRPSSMSYGRNFERGTYSISNGVLTLHLKNQVNTFNDRQPRAAGQGARVAASDSSAQSRTAKIHLLGNRGDKGVVIDGQTFNIRHGW